MEKAIHAEEFPMLIRWAFAASHIEYLRGCYQEDTSPVRFLMQKKKEKKDAFLFQNVT